MRLLFQARAGNQYAHKKLVDIVSADYHSMIHRFYVAADPIIGQDDVEGEFYWGIWRAVPQVDGRGDPIFHLAQRGQWAVKSLLYAVHKRKHGITYQDPTVQVSSLDGAPDPVWEPRDDSWETDPQAVVQVREDQIEAKQRVMSVLVNADLGPSPRAQEMLRLMLAGEFDKTELGAITNLAMQWGVSDQRVSQVYRWVSERLLQADIEAGGFPT